MTWTIRQVSMAILSAVLLASWGGEASATGSGNTSLSEDDTSLTITVTNSTTTTTSYPSYSPPGPWTQTILRQMCVSICLDGGEEEWWGETSIHATGSGAADYEISPEIGSCFSTPPPCTTADGQAGHSYLKWTRQIAADDTAAGDFGGDTSRRPDPVCIADTEAAQMSATRPVITVEMVVDMAEAQVPEPSFILEPSGTSYVNIPNNYAADVSAQTVTVQVLGYSIPVEFVPETTTWSFGDGGSATGEGIEHATVGQGGSVEHSYRRQGTDNVSVTTKYTTTVVFPNVQRVTLDEPLSGTSTPQAYTIREIQSIVTDIG